MIILGYMYGNRQNYGKKQNVQLRQAAPASDFSIIIFSIINVWGSTCWTCHGSTIQTPFFGGLYVCKCKYVVSTQLVAWQKDTSRICMYVQQWVLVVQLYINGRLRGIYQIFRHIFSIIQYSPLKCIQIANRWTYSHRQSYGKKNMEKKGS